MDRKNICLSLLLAAGMLAGASMAGMKRKCEELRITDEQKIREAELVQADNFEDIIWLNRWTKIIDNKRPVFTIDLEGIKGNPQSFVEFLLMRNKSLAANIITNIKDAATLQKLYNQTNSIILIKDEKRYEAEAVAHLLSVLNKAIKELI